MPQNAVRTFIIKHLDALIAAVAGFFIVNLYMHYAGIGISPDSIMYMSTARNLNAHQGLNYFGGKPIVAFPVFYPIFLAVVQFITHTDPLVLGPALDGTLFGLLIFLTGVIIEGFNFPTKLYKWFILAILALSPSLLEVYTMLWSETLFILLTLVFFMVYYNYARQHTTRALLWVAGVTAIACITRYAAITLVGTGGMLLLFDMRLHPRKKLWHIVLFGGISISLLVANLVRNSFVTHTGTGPRYKSLTSLVDNMHYFGTVMCDWFTLTPAQYNYAAGITALLIASFGFAFLYYAFRKKNDYGTYENIVTAFFIVYGLFMIISATISRYERINNRLLSPLFIPFLLGCTYWITNNLRNKKLSLRPLYIALACFIGIVFVYREYATDYQRYDDQGDYGVPGYTDDSWNKSPLVGELKKPGLFKPGYTIYNNVCEGFYFFTGKGSEYIPHIDSVKQVKKFYAQKKFYVVYFNLLPDTALFSVKQIQQKRPLKTIFTCPDGGIYEYNQETKN